MVMGIDLEDELIGQMRSENPLVLYAPRKLSLNTLAEIHLSYNARELETILAEEFSRYKPAFHTLALDRCSKSL